MFRLNFAGPKRTKTQRWFFTSIFFSFSWLNFLCLQDSVCFFRISSMSQMCMSMIEVGYVHHRCVPWRFVVTWCCCISDFKSRHPRRLLLSFSDSRSLGELVIQGFILQFLKPFFLDRAVTSSNLLGLVIWRHFAELNFDQLTIALLHVFHRVPVSFHWWHHWTHIYILKLMLIIYFLCFLGKMLHRASCIILTLATPFACCSFPSEQLLSQRGAAGQKILWYQSLLNAFSNPAKFGMLDICNSEALKHNHTHL